MTTRVHKPYSFYQTNEFAEDSDGKWFLPTPPRNINNRKFLQESDVGNALRKNMSLDSEQIQELKMTVNAVMNRPLTKSEMQMGLESVLRSMAHLSEGDEKIRLVDEANRVRPMSSR
jgi:hypothetical protein